jgi:hypothetical protein
MQNTDHSQFVFFSVEAALLLAPLAAYCSK